ncbi:MAG: acyltransferase [Niabella sp.]
MSSKKHPRPRWWIRNLVNPFVHKKAGSAVIRRHARMDIFPYNRFSLGKNSLIEDFAVVNNGVGDVHIGEDSIIGIGCAIIGPVTIGNHVMFAQHIAISGLNHGYEDVNMPPAKQQVVCKEIIIEDNVWIGANAVITAGVRIGKHSVIGAGSVVTKDIDAYSVVVGNPAKVLKQYNFTTGKWEPPIR